jgi:hypothetical protein
MERRRQWRKQIPGTIRDTLFPAGSGDTQDRGSGAEESPDTGKESLIALYSRIRKEQGLSAASRAAYQRLSGRIATDLNLRRHRALTAREVSRKCQKKPYCGPFARFVTAYEKIRYGGQISVKDQSVLEKALGSTEEQMGGKDH